MYLKDLIIDGFKSYAQKTVIKDFDTHFNAITGLNGSGKSNILDSIIFLLGISGYRDLRASDTRDLIYKQGSAGITMASVTGVFDNSDPQRSPNGYSDCPTITVTRQILQTGVNKYFINNKKASQTDLQEMFQSVQLNVLNPHFIIMQGRIVKVCNMKPPELLKLVEEATGTTMYDTKRDQSLKLIEKKKQTLDGTGALLEELKKRKEQLAIERDKYDEYQSLDSKLSRSKKILAATTYVHTKRQIQDHRDELTNAERIIAEYDDKNDNLTQQLTKHQDEMQALLTDLNQRRADINGNDEYSTLTNELLKAEGELKNCKTVVDQTDKLLNKKQQEVFLLENQYKKLQSKHLDLKRQFELLKQQKQECQGDIDSLRATLLGFDDQDGKNKKNDGNTGGSGYQQRKALCERELTDIEIQFSNLRDNINEFKQEMRDIVQRRQQNGDEQMYHTLTKKITELETQLDPLSTSLVVQIRNIIQDIMLSSGSNAPPQLNDYNLQQCAIVLNQRCLPQLRQREIQLDNDLRVLHTNQQQQGGMGNLRQRADLWHVLKNLGMMEHINTQNLPNGAVAGLLVNLLQIESPEQYALPVELALGAKLFNIVVDTYANGTQLLNRNRGGDFQLNLLALDRAETRLFPMMEQAIHRVRQQFGQQVVLVGDIVKVKQSLLENNNNNTNLPPHFDQILRVACGNTFICRDKDTAKRVAGLGCRAVTQQGDVYDPSGIITGGSNSGINWLNDYLSSQNTNGNAQIQKVQHDLQQIRGLISRATICGQEYDNLNVKIQELEHTKDRVKRIAWSTTQERLDWLENAIKTAESQEIPIFQDKIKHLNEQIKEYTIKLQQFAEEDKSKEGQQLREKKMKVEIQTKQNKIQEFTRELDVLQRTLGQQEDEMGNILEQSNELKNDIQEAQQRRYVQQQKQEDISNLMFDLSEKRNTAKIQREANERGFQTMQDDLEQQQRRITIIEKNIRENKNKRDEIKNRIEQTKQHIEHLTIQLKRQVKEHPWIKHEEEKFYKPSDPLYVGENKTPEELKAELEKDESTHRALKRYNDPMCIEKLDSIEREYNDKHEKYKRLLQDRTSISKSIQLLDQKKIETVENTFQVVNKYFSSIFSILLPGANSRLRPHRDKNNILVGCEMEVAFSGHWKESLSELSGGQRSLLALSLILALLRCKPAPLYILDEIDAALDASHTQNIGKTIREHFQQSQFIIVSLKEGMFENANMLIRTQLGPNGSALNVTRRK